MNDTTTETNAPRTTTTVHEQDGQMVFWPECLTIDLKTAAEMVGVSRTMFWHLRKWGKIGPKETQVGRLVKYNRAEFEEWVNTGMPDADKWRATERKEGR